jgi:putative serine protease PepD
LADGDVIVTIDGETVSGAESLTAQVRERGPGDKVVMGVVRDGKLIEVSVTLATRQDEGN